MRSFALVWSSCFDSLSPSARRSQTARRNSLAYGLGMHYLQVAHDQTLKNSGSAYGVKAIWRPRQDSNLRTRFRNRKEPVFAVGPSDVCPVQGPCPVRVVSPFPPGILHLIPKGFPKSIPKVGSQSRVS